MPLYCYEAFDRVGKKTSGTIEAASAQMAKEVVRSKNLMPISIKSIEAQVSGFTIASLFEKPVDHKSKILFTQQFAVLLRAGVPLLQSIELLVNQFEGRLRRILISVKDDLKGGQSLAASLSKFPKVFSNVYVQLVRAGEATGKLEGVLERLIDYLEKAEALRKRVKKALTYPIFMISFALVVVGVMITYVVPNVSKVMAQPGKPLPGPTQLLVNLSDFFVGNFWILLGSLTLFVLFFLYWKSTPRGKLILDKISLRIPIVSYFSKIKAVVQFSKTLGLLLDSGVNLAEALDIVTNIIDNSVLTKSLDNARDKIIKEGKIAHYLEETKIFPSIASYMIDTGEKSGELAKMLLNVGKDYDVILTDLTDSLVSKINPIMTFVISGFVFFIMLSMFLPMLEMIDVLETIK
ncbi:type II secretion system F family protein [Candidatus Babeliales bacterium]|nr:type II secretion system F family protein [Candidatus Babeliales bacterium]